MQFAYHGNHLHISHLGYHTCILLIKEFLVFFGESYIIRLHTLFILQRKFGKMIITFLKKLNLLNE